MSLEDADIRSSGAIEDVAVGMVVDIEMLLLCFLARRSRGYNYWRVTYYQGSKAPKGTCTGSCRSVNANKNLAKILLFKDTVNFPLYKDLSV